MINSDYTIVVSVENGEIVPVAVAKVHWTNTSHFMFSYLMSNDTVWPR